MDVIAMIERLSEKGHAPSDGCGLFDIGNDERIERIRKTYLENRFQRGISSEKFVVGPFGSGKTHFVNQLCEVARNMDCVSSTVALTRDVDVTSNYYIYREIAREIRPPDSTNRGIRNLMISCFDRVDASSQKQTDSREKAGQFLRMWIEGLEEHDFELDMFGRVARQAFDSYLKNDRGRFDSACQWIAGELESKPIAKTLDIPPIAKRELNLIARRISLSLYQLIKKVGYHGTVVVFDEAEQGFEIGKRKQSVLYSLMQSEINSIVNLDGGSVLMLYAIVPAIREGMMDFPALQQRVSHPIPFDENVRAPIIEINRPERLSKEEIIDELESIGTKLTDLMFAEAGSRITIPRDDVVREIHELAVRITEENINISGRRDMVKGTCSLLMHVHDNGELLDLDDVLASDTDDEVEDEV